MWFSFEISGKRRKDEEAEGEEEEEVNMTDSDQEQKPHHHRGPEPAPPYPSRSMRRLPQCPPVHLSHPVPLSLTLSLSGLPRPPLPPPHLHVPPRGASFRSASRHNSCRMVMGPLLFAALSQHLGYPDLCALSHTPTDPVPDNHQHYQSLA
ncbi:hypothetical protein EYF80_015868 [Liparis tanakae]|uniref:Uncharacterized protein n=1 Tax=Liparis tanakae TaxID=230148 RepID=A0A4Z2I7T5_9TELE|nr:hypothetical protein EYF80_015868 [Liparis tanakae]